MVDPDSRTLLGHSLLRTLVPVVLAIALILPAQAQAAGHTRGRSPDAAPGARLATGGALPHPAARLARPAARLARPAARLARPAARLARPAIGMPRPAAAPAARLSARVSRRPDAPPAATRPARAGAGVPPRDSHASPTAKVQRRRRRIVLPAMTPPTGAPTTSPTLDLAAAVRGTALDFAPAVRHTAIRPASRLAARVPRSGRAPRLMYRRRLADRVHPVAAMTAAAPLTPPVPGSLPPAGTAGPATGGGTAGTVAAAILALAGMGLLRMLLPGLLALDLLPARSTILELHLERPG